MIDELEREYGANTVREGGLKVYTTIDPRLQRNAIKAIRDVLPYKTDPAAAIVSVEPGTGAIRAMTAVVRSARQPVQPRGAVGAPGRLDVQDVRARVGDREGRRSRLDLLHLGAVHVHDRARGAATRAEAVGRCTPTATPTRGSISVTRATLSSDNTVYAQLTLDVGPRYVWQMAHRLGVHMSPDKPVASIGLGSLAVSPLDMAAAYATFAAMGIYAKPMAITKVILPGGKVDTTSGWGKPQTKRALSQGVAWKVNDVLASERALRHRRRLGRRHPPERRQDGHDREPRRRLVRRLHRGSSAPSSGWAIRRARSRC